MPTKRTDPVRERRGRPPRVALSTEVIAEIVNLIEQGTFPLSAARSVGISRRTWYRYLADGENEKADITIRNLWTSVERARGRLASKLYSTIKDAALGHEQVMRDGKGNVMFEERNGKPVPMMEHVPGNWIAAARALESLSPDEFLRQTGGGNAGLGGGGTEGETIPTEFEIVYLASNRDPKEMREIEKRVQERAGQA